MHQPLLIELPQTQSTVSKARRKTKADTDRIAPIDKNQQFTPRPIADFARKVFRFPIELDPTSSAIANEAIQATRYYTEEDDALLQDWTAKTLWFNPPYGRGLVAPMVSKFIEELPKIQQAMVLVNSGTSTRWFQLLMSHATAILTLDRRIQFWNAESLPDEESDRIAYQTRPNGKNEYDQTIFYFGHNLDLFIEFGSELGNVTLPATSKTNAHLRVNNENPEVETGDDLVRRAIVAYERELQEIGDCARSVLISQWRMGEMFTESLLRREGSTRRKGLTRSQKGNV